PCARRCCRQCSRACSPPKRCRSTHFPAPRVMASFIRKVPWSSITWRCCTPTRSQVRTTALALWGPRLFSTTAVMKRVRNGASRSISARLGSVTKGVRAWRSSWSVMAGAGLGPQKKKVPRRATRDLPVCVRGRLLHLALKVGTGLELHHLLGRDLDLLAGLGVAAFTSGALGRGEGAEAHQGHSLTFLQRRGGAVHEGAQRALGIGLGDLCLNG